MEYRNGTCGVGNNTRSKGRHMTCTIIQTEKYQKRAMDIEIDNDMQMLEPGGRSDALYSILRVECNEPLSQV